MCGAWWQAFQDGRLPREGYVKAGELSRLGGGRIHPAPLGAAIGRVLGLNPNGHEGRRGYDLGELYAFLKACLKGTTTT